MHANSETGGSRSSLYVQRVYMPRSIRSSYSNNDINSPTSQISDQPSPGGNSNGYTADFSEVDSVSGSVASASRYYSRPNPVTDNLKSLTDSGLESGTGKRYTPSVSSCQETDIDSLDDNRYRYEGELYKPTAHSSHTNITVEIKRLKGECHPRALPRDQLPSMSSGDEVETSSCTLVPSFSGVPRPAPRSSLRRKKSTNSALSYTDDDDTSSKYSRTDSKYSGAESLPRGILKSSTYSTDLSDTESFTTEGGRFQRQSSRRQSKVRFEHVKKGEEARRKTISHNDDEVTDGKKKKQKKPNDIWAVMSGPTIKPARNHPQRQSDRSRGSRRRSSQDRARPSSRNSSQRRSSSQGRRSSSTDRKSSNSTLDNRRKDSAASMDRANYPADEMIQKDNTASKDRTSSISSSLDRQSNPSRNPKQSRSSAENISSNQRYSIGTGQVTLQMEDPQLRSTRKSSANRHLVTLPPPSDKQKLMKWVLIIGLPILLLIVAVAVVIPLVV